jgi:hypothetical protein
MQIPTLFGVRKQSHWRHQVKCVRIMEPQKAMAVWNNKVIYARKKKIG